MFFLDAHKIHRVWREMFQQSYELFSSLEKDGKYWKATRRFYSLISDDIRYDMKRINRRVYARVTDVIESYPLIYFVNSGESWFDETTAWVFFVGERGEIYFFGRYRDSYRGNLEPVTLVSLKWFMQFDYHYWEVKELTPEFRRKRIRLIGSYVLEPIAVWTKKAEVERFIEGFTSLMARAEVLEKQNFCITSDSRLRFLVEMTLKYAEVLHDRLELVRCAMSMSQKPDEESRYERWSYRYLFSELDKFISSSFDGDISMKERLVNAWHKFLYWWKRLKRYVWYYYDVKLPELGRVDWKRRVFSLLDGVDLGHTSFDEIRYWLYTWIGIRSPRQKYPTDDVRAQLSWYEGDYSLRYDLLFAGVFPLGRARGIGKYPLYHSARRDFFFYGNERKVLKDVFTVLKSGTIEETIVWDGLSHVYRFSLPPGIYRVYMIYDASGNKTWRLKSLKF